MSELDPDLLTQETMLEAARNVDYRAHISRLQEEMERVKLDARAMSCESEAVAALEARVQQLEIACIKIEAERDALFEVIKELHSRLEGSRDYAGE